MGSSKRVTVVLTEQQIEAVIESLAFEVDFLGEQISEKAQGGAAQDGPELVGLRITKRLLSNAKERLEKAIKEKP